MKLNSHRNSVGSKRGCREQGRQVTAPTKRAGDRDVQTQHVYNLQCGEDTTAKDRPPTTCSFCLYIYGNVLHQPQTRKVLLAAATHLWALGLLSPSRAELSGPRETTRPTKPGIPLCFLSVALHRRSLYPGLGTEPLPGALCSGTGSPALGLCSP